MNDHLLRFDKTKKILLFDFETFNLCLSFIHNRPWQVGSLLIQGDRILESYESNIKWPGCDLKISKEAAIVTHFNEIKYNLTARDESEVFAELYPKIEEADLILGHNILGFDIFLLKEWYKMYNKPWKHLINKLIDTNCLARGIKMDIKYKQGDNLLEYQYRTVSRKQKGVKTRLEVLGKEYSINHDYESLHEALSDVALNKKVWDKLKWEVEI